MNTRLQQRLCDLESRFRPKGRHFAIVHFVDEEPDATSRDEQFAAFKAERGVGPNDAVHTVTITFS